MANCRKSDFKAVQNRNRVNFHRRWKLIVERENQSSNDATAFPNPNINQENSNEEYQQNENIAASERLRRWALEYNISKRAVSALLKILIALGLTWLPKDSRTLFSTPRYIEMQNLTNGKLWYSVLNIPIEYTKCSVSNHSLFDIFNISLIFMLIPSA